MILILLKLSCLIKSTKKTKTQFYFSKFKHAYFPHLCAVFAPAAMNLIRNYAVRISGVSRVREFHSSAVLSRDGVPIRWLTYNDKMYPPQAPDEPRRPAVSISSNFKIS